MHNIKLFEMRKKNIIESSYKVSALYVTYSSPYFSINGKLWCKYVDKKSKYDRGAF